jgi:predicted homoserine dehydrogenase-like protein
VPGDRVLVTDDPADAQAALDTGRFVATRDVLLACSLRGVDAVVDATGDLLVGTRVAAAALEARKHVVAANADVQATVGPMLKELANRAGVVYSDIEGDEPGLLKGLFDYCTDIGLEVVVGANGKGVLKRYATPVTQAAFATDNGIQPWLATAAADGTKLNLELTVVANATGFLPAVRGMHGPATELGRIVEDFRNLDLLDGGHYVDYVLGNRGVFAVVRSEDPEVRSDFRYLKLGDGPYYVLHRPEVLAHYAAPVSIRRAVRLSEATITPLGGPVADTIAFAKRDLSPGRRLDGIGGFDTYGLIVRADEAIREQLLPIGISQYARVRRPVRQGTPLGYHDVEFEEDNLALELRRRQDAHFGITASVHSSA